MDAVFFDCSRFAIREKNFEKAHAFFLFLCYNLYVENATTGVLFSRTDDGHRPVPASFLSFSDVLMRLNISLHYG